ncbi:UDP-N-acetylmuramoyl-L-alanyl-D-glutamate--2,6-diaminopimelate ligase [Salisediminibacterium beveridgei]|nr:UDP-N-acetylmuramoyl-L-alanyl-D-glutamate--2,6-diaminopimelate ligase [Salisediminibacterium beveridgei]
MKLYELTNILASCRIEGNPETDIQSLEMDSRKVMEGALFFCIRGFTVDGHEFAKQAKSKGAVAFVTEKKLDVEGVQIIVNDSKRAMALMSACFYDYPSSKMQMIGVTGTNGKTTVTHFIQHLLKAAGKNAGMIGTMYTEMNGIKTDTLNTTPESFVLQSLLHEMTNHRVDSVTMEVSSHALQMGRVHGTDFDIGVYTNLSQDHLDYHKTMDQYAYAKSLLFSRMGNAGNNDVQKRAVINIDDDYAEVMIGACAVPVLTYGIHNACDFRAMDVVIKPGGVFFSVESAEGSFPVTLTMTGLFSVYNALAAFAAGYAAGLSCEFIAETLSDLPQVSGRFETVPSEPAPFQVIVDYAHTPESLRNVLETAKAANSSRLTVVFGCGGDRDKDKRPLMGAIAESLADKVFITSDNPRSEVPEMIIEDILKGMQKENHQVITDRKEAIYRAVCEAEEKELILIAGKGHESYQIIGDQTYDFNDRLVAIEAIKERYQ